MTGSFWMVLQPSCCMVTVLLFSCNFLMAWYSSQRMSSHLLLMASLVGSLSPGRRLDTVSLTWGWSTTINGRLHPKTNSAIFLSGWSLAAAVVQNTWLLRSAWLLAGGAGPKCGAASTFLWLSGASLRDDGVRTLCTVLLRFTGSGLFDTIVTMCLDLSNVVTLYFQTEFTLSGDLWTVHPQGE